jgi:hypothetical protein
MAEAAAAVEGEPGGRTVTAARAAEATLRNRAKTAAAAAAAAETDATRKKEV